MGAATAMARRPKAAANANRRTDPTAGCRPVALIEPFMDASECADERSSDLIESGGRRGEAAGRSVAYVFVEEGPDEGPGDPGHAIGVDRTQHLEVGQRTPRQTHVAEVLMSTSRHADPRRPADRIDRCE